MIPVLLLLAQCATYGGNRLRDAADIFTFTLETGSYGASVRVGPLKTGANYKGEHGKAIGLRGGRVGDHYSADFTAIFFGADYFSMRPIRFDDWLPASAREEQTSDAQREGLAEFEGLDAEQIEAMSPEERAELMRRYEQLRRENENKNADATDSNERDESDSEAITPETIEAAQNAGEAELRRKVYRARAPLGTAHNAHEYSSLLKDDEVRFAPPTYFFQIETQIGLWGGMRAGVNPLEFLDFVLGLFTIDILSDDKPYPDPRRQQMLDQLERDPIFRSLDEKTREELLRNLMEQPSQLPGQE